MAQKVEKEASEGNKAESTQQTSNSRIKIAMRLSGSKGSLS